MEGRSGNFPEMVHALDKRFRSADDTPKRVGMASQKFRGAVDHHVRTQLQRVLVDRSREGVVHHNGRTDTMPRLGQSRQVHDLQRRVGRALQVEDITAGGNSCFDGFVIGCVVQVGRNLKARQEFHKDLAGAAVRVLGRYDTAPRRQQREQRIADCRHPRRETRRGFRAFELADLLFECMDGWIGVPAIDMSGLVAQRNLLPVIDILVAKCHAVYDRNLGAPLCAVFLFSSPHSQCAGCGTVIVVHVFYRPPLFYVSSLSKRDSTRACSQPQMPVVPAGNQGSSRQWNPLDGVALVESISTLQGWTH